MKKRKLAVVSFLAAAALTCGIGYAKVSDTLDIQGTADVDIAGLNTEFNEDIYFLSGTDNITISEASKATASINTDNNDKASFTVSGLLNEDDEVTITYTIKNDSDHIVSVNLTTPTAVGATNPTNNKPGYFGVKYYFTDGTTDTEITDAAVTGTINSGSTLKVKVVVTLLQTPTEAISGSFSIEMVATAGN